jgi:hypothetical protein
VENVERVTQRAIDWLMRVRNPDFGWGDHANTKSAASCTSESVIGFARCRMDMQSRSVQECLSLLRDHISKRTPGVTKETRNAALPLLAVIEGGDAPSSELVQRQAEVVRNYRIGPEGWPLKPDEKICNILDSALALKSLVYSKKIEAAELLEAKKWFYRKQRSDGGWPFYIDEDRSNLACTAHVAHTLIEAGETAETTGVKSAIQYLLRNRNAKGGWDVNWEDDPLHNHAKWFHYNSPFAMLVLLQSGFDPKSDDVRRGVESILADDDGEGGWKPLEDYESFTWASANAIMPLGEYTKLIRASQ